MSILTTKKLRVQFLGITPVYQGKDGTLNPQEIISLSAVLTFRGASLKKIFREIKKSRKSLTKKMQNILMVSSLRGHASIATTPSLCLAFEASKFLDSALTGLVFSSSLMASGRRTDTSVRDIVFPEKIWKKKKAKEIYYRASKQLIDTFNYLLKNGVIKDEASRLLQYGIYGTGIIQLPLESILSIRKELDLEGEWMPEEILFLLEKIEKQSKKLGFDWLWATRRAAPRNVYIYPDIFKNPQKTNIVRELRAREGKFFETKIVSFDDLATSELKEKLKKLNREIKRKLNRTTKVKKNWQRVLDIRQEIVRDYNLALRIKVLSSIPWRVWGEKKRHRTVPMISDSVYWSIGRTLKVFKKEKKAIESEKIDKDVLREIDCFFNIPEEVSKNKKFLKLYLKASLDAFLAYEELLGLGIKERDAIFLIPRALKIDVLQDYDLYNLITGYYPLRSCKTAEKYLRTITLKEIDMIKRELESRGLKEVADLMGVKCEGVGFCPEVESCFWVRKVNNDYNEKRHQEMARELEKEFRSYL